MMHGLSRASLLRCNGCSNPAVTDGACHRTRTDIWPPSGMVSLESVCSPWVPVVVPTGTPAYRASCDERFDICVQARPVYSITSTLLGFLNAEVPDVKLLKNLFTLFKGSHNSMALDD